MISEDARRLPGLRPSMIQQALAGRDGWDRLEAVCTPAILGYMRRRGLGQADALDVCQEVLAAMARYLGDYDAGRSFAGWLYMIVNQRFITHRRRAGRQVGVGGTDNLGAVQAMAAPESEEEDFRLDLLRGALDRARAELEETAEGRLTWKCFEEKNVHGRPGKEIAAEVGLTPTAVFMRAHKVRTMVRELLGIENSEE